MRNIFTKEEKMISKAERLIDSGSFSTPEDENHYRELLEEYKVLYQHMKRIVRLSDITQSKLKATTEKLNEISNIDALTGLYNRRYFDDALKKEWNSALRLKSSIVLIMIDIDFFKKYNDTYGHLQGDKCLKEVAEAIKNHAKRPRDIVVRFGGEEFMLLLPETKMDGAIRVAERILSGIENMKIEHSASPINQVVTVSIGVTSVIPDQNISVESVLEKADKALYTAKNDGRNCIRTIY